MAKAASAPKSATITSYQVGFGDCYLMSFDYGTSKRHVLIDFGTKMRSKVQFKVDMVKVADQIAKDCDGKLTMVVATHRHYDHISGFETKKGGKGSGDIIRALKPDLVVQPWTEDPKLAKNATAPASSAAGSASGTAHVRALANMQAFADAISSELESILRTKGRPLSAAAAELSYIGGDNITNKSAVENLMTMGRLPAKYLQLGSTLSVTTLLPGVKISVFGPPTLKQNAKLGRYAGSSDEYWKMQAAAVQPDLRNSKGLPGASPNVPVPARWFSHRMQAMREDSFLAISRVLDKVVNNTSLILLFEFGGKSLLFPGDAQIENWSSALADPKIVARLKDVDVYKVGHHGSFNATPVSLWNGFAKSKKKALQTLLSTHAGEYNDVPLGDLHDALEKGGPLLTTEAFAKNEISRSVTV